MSHKEGGSHRLISESCPREAFHENELVNPGLLANYPRATLLELGLSDWAVQQPVYADCTSTGTPHCMVSHRLYLFFYISSFFLSPSPCNCRFSFWVSLCGRHAIVLENVFSREGVISKLSGTEP